MLPRSVAHKQPSKTQLAFKYKFFKDRSILREITTTILWLPKLEMLLRYVTKTVYDPLVSLIFLKNTTCVLDRTRAKGRNWNPWKVCPVIA